MNIKKYNTFENKVNVNNNDDNIIDNIISIINNQFNNKIESLTDNKNRRIELVQKISNYLLSLDNYLTISNINNRLIFNFEYDFLTIDIFNKIMEICNTVNSLSYYFIEFKTINNIKIQCSEITDAEFLKRNRISRILIDYNIK